MGETSAATGIDQRKRALRKHFRTLRAGLGDVARTEADTTLVGRVCALDAFAEATVVLTYLDVGPEVRTRGIVERAWAAGKQVALPYCVPGTREMRWYRVHSFEEVAKGAFGVWEPTPIDENEQALGTGERMIALVPGLAFDAAGYRLGYGGGFYDTFLAAFEGTSVGLCREAQLVESLRELGVVDAHDLPVHVVVSERRTILTS